MHSFVSILLMPLIATLGLQSGRIATGDPPVGYSWSAPLPKPSPLKFNTRQVYGSTNSAGLYDYQVQTVGDNWSVSNPTSCSTIHQPAGANVSVRFSSDVQEQSCGWVVWRRGPYTDGTEEAQRGAWKVGCPENAGPALTVSMPIITHHGGDFRRYWTNGWPFIEATDFSQDGPIGQFYHRTQAIGPLRLDGTRQALPNPVKTTLDVTLLSAVPNIPSYVAFCWVDQFGREGPLCEPVLCPAIEGSKTTTVEVSRRCQPPQGSCCVHLYAGTARSRLYRQAILNPTGSRPQWDWPLHLTRFYLHELRTDVLYDPSLIDTARSWLNPIQQLIEAGQTIINKPGTWQLYCPLILKYDANNFGRMVGDHSARLKLIQATMFASPTVIILNQRDALRNVDVVAKSACAAIATSDFDGGQAFSNELTGCTFTNAARDGYGLTVDEESSIAWGEHTASELLARHCTFTASRPIKLEGRQTAKFRFDDRTTLNCNGQTRYLNEICALEIFTPNTAGFDTIEGVNGLNKFRTFAGLYSNEGPPTLRLRDLFIDRGCSVGFAFGPNTGGIVDLDAGDKIGIYPADRSWFRLAECPNSLAARLRTRGFSFPESCSILAYNLNSFVADLDRPIKEIITPSSSEWTARKLPLQFAGRDWSIRPQQYWTYGRAGTPDTIPRQPILDSADPTVK